jgi:hypothetical protein
LWRWLVGSNYPSSYPAATVQENRAASELERRLAAVEEQLPRFRVEMAALADQAEDILERATRRQKRSEQARREAEQAAQPDPEPAGFDLGTEFGREQQRRALKLAGRV